MLSWKELEVTERSRGETEQQMRHHYTSHLYIICGNKRDEKYRNTFRLSEDMREN